MSRVIALTISQFEMPRLGFVSLARLRHSFTLATTLNSDAARVLADNESIRNSSRYY